jgi:hypothetical protein
VGVLLNKLVMTRKKPKLLGEKRKRTILWKRRTKELLKKTLVCRKVDSAKMELACNEVINMLRRTLKLEPFECFYVIETLYKTFPKEDLTR